MEHRDVENLEEHYTSYADDEGKSEKRKTANAAEIKETQEAQQYQHLEQFKNPSTPRTPFNAESKEQYVSSSYKLPEVESEGIEYVAVDRPKIIKPPLIIKPKVKISLPNLKPPAQSVQDERIQIDRPIVLKPPELSYSLPQLKLPNIKAVKVEENVRIPIERPKVSPPPSFRKEKTITSTLQSIKINEAIRNFEGLSQIYERARDLDLSAFAPINCEGSTLIVYSTPGLEDSLGRIAVEVARICGERFNPYHIDGVYEPIKRIKASESGTREGIYVFVKNDKICNLNDVELQDVLGSIKGLMGYKFSIVIMPDCLYFKLQFSIGNSPARILVESRDFSFTREQILTIAYLASGFQDDKILDRSYSALKDVNGPFNDILDESTRWLLANHVDLFRPSQGKVDSSESTTHEGLKAVIIRHLIENENVKPEDIRVEEELQNGLIPDVRVGNVVYDAKTSFSVSPVLELYDLVNKYGARYEIVGVFRPLPILLQLGAIVNKLISDRKRGVRVNVMIPVKENEKVRLIKLEEFLKKGVEHYAELKESLKKS